MSSGFCSNLQLKFMWCLNGWSLWNMLIAEFTGVISTHFTRSNFMSIFEVVFFVWVYGLSFVITGDYFGSGLCSNLQVKFVWFLNGWSLWNLLTPCLQMLFRQTFYKVEFDVDFRGCVFGLSLWVEFCYNRWLFRFRFMLEFTGEICVISKWVMFMEFAYSRVYGCYFAKHFTRSNFMSILEVGFLVWVFSLIYG